MQIVAGSLLAIHSIAMKMRVKTDRPDAIIAKLKGRSKVEAFEAAKQLWDVDSNALAKELIAILRSGSRPFHRSAAAYAMQAVSSADVIFALERTVRNKSENADVRAHAVEALSHHHSPASHRLLLENLLDPSKHVRFWCAYALGEMQERQAIPALLLLRTDKRIVTSSRTVREEAAHAIRTIERRKSSTRCPYCGRDGR